MKCPNCSSENPNEAKYCFNCGNPITQTCPNCNHINAPEAKFCLNCGYSLKTDKQEKIVRSSTNSLNVDQRLERLAASTPHTLADKMRSSSNLAGERRVVTALFADVVDSTSMAETMDPEDWAAIMNQAFDLFVPVIYRYEGTIARLMGDALLAFFGAPLAHEDDPVRAIYAGLHLLDVAHHYAEKVRRQYGVDFALRVGMNTGPVVVGEVGSNLVYEYTAMGDAVNLAARMQAAARPMTVMISENTYRFAAPVFEYSDLGLIKVKGKAEPVRAYEVLAPKRQPGRLRGLPGLAAPMVGREQELYELEKASLAVRAGLGRLVLVIGEAGIGKSRLIAEWKSRVNGDGSKGLNWIEGRCLSYGQGLAYHLLIDVLRSKLGLSETASEAETRATLKSTLEDLLNNEIEDVYPYLGHLLSLRLEGPALERVQQLGPQGLQAQVLAALRKLLLALASRQPQVIVLEDLHWADPSSVGLLHKLLPLAGSAPILFCFVTRPDRTAPGWKIVSEAREALEASLTEINLQPLSDDESCQLVTNLLNINAFPNSLRSLVLSKSEGNPFFLEEIIRMLIDRQIIVHEESGWVAREKAETINIPDTLQGLLLARIDRLPEGVRHTLRVASVIGRQFPVKVLETVLAGEDQASGNIGQDLNRAESAGLFMLASVQPDTEYAFRHSFIQDVAYASLVKTDRQRLHRKVGEALENYCSDRLAEFAPRLAVHFDLAGNIQAALKYFFMAGNAAAEIYANDEAVLHYSRALEIILSDAFEADREQELVTDIFSRRGRVLELMARYDDALNNYIELEEWALTSGDEAMELVALMARATLHSTPTSQFNPKFGQELTDRALDLAHRLDDLAAEARIFWNLTLKSFFEGKLDQAAEYGEQALTLGRQFAQPEQLAYTLTDIGGFVYLMLGDFERSRSTLDEAISLWREQNNLPMLADTLSSLAEVYYFWGDFDHSLKLTDEAHRISQSAGNVWGLAYSSGMSCLSLIELGEIDRASVASEEAIRLGNEAGFVAARAIVRSTYAVLLGRLGDVKRGIEYAVRAVQNSMENVGFWLSPAYGSLALLKVLDNDLSEAESVLDQAKQAGYDERKFVFDAYTLKAYMELDLALGNYDQVITQAGQFLDDSRLRNAWLHVPYALYYLGKAWLGLKEYDSARAAFTEACSHAERIQARLVLYMTLAALANLELHHGNQAAAQGVCSRGRAVVDYLENKIREPELKEKFSKHPGVELLKFGCEVAANDLRY